MIDQGYLLRHIQGALASALIGDSMGAATEGMTPEQIRQRFGQPVHEFYGPPAETFAAGRKPGQLTDDSTQMVEMLKAVVECKGVLTVESVAQHLLKWAENEELFSRFSGPSTRKAILQLREGKNPSETGLPATPLDVVSNGAAMKVALDEAKALGWTVVSMRRDWMRIFYDRSE
jgi:ADP-ribosylglycohydrolase